MNDKRFLRNWYAGASIAAVVIGAVAALLLVIISTARSILSNANRALSVANEIVNNTRSIWELEQTNAVASQLVARVESIERRAGEVADTLEVSQPAAG